MFNRLRYFFVVVFGFSLVGIISCEKNTLQIDVSDIKVEIEIQRFDLDLYTIEPDSINIYIQRLEKRYGKFFELYNNKIIQIGNPGDAGYEEYMTTFLYNYTTIEAYKETNRIFKDLKWLKNDLTKVLKHYKYYYPENKMPDIYTYVSGFNQSIVITENFIGIGLDKYLGEENRLYEALQVSRYLRKKMIPEKIVPDCAFALGTSLIEYKDSIDNLISNIIHQGKLMYFTDALLPELNDSLKIGYSGKQLEWCKRYEKDMWAYLIENKHLFSTDLMIIKRYIEESPFTKSFSADSPGRTGIWIGWQIVRSYMKNNPEISLQELIKNNNYQDILNKSKYNP